MRKWLVTIPLLFTLAACGNDENGQQNDANSGSKVKTEAVATQQAPTYLSSTEDWEVDERLQEPTEESLCEMCNMKVYTREHEMGVFSAQAIKADGTTAFYDDIGCLVNAELKFKEQNEKYVRDYISLNWLNVEEATIVKTELKSPMNWGYIFFKFEEDAKTYIAQNPAAHVEQLATIQATAKERMMKKMKEKEAEGKGPEEMDVEDHEGHMETEDGEDVHE
ncbi:hypothetical protein CSE16_04235 [Solibacillus sp. R5-41]|uniref:nitrous oxide reductase accessory protein NosL n=1 Tax=Solibacillus sp. R5-41 TaxID=2048654 RepID=UPI000C128195|nr:hypothetical protein [Solibacillus sp. R5-41]ATP39312.1 hypothetical protein CSE16_04235 [Solibacillus sp. R5-41]